jgi:hypothetical protein
MEERIMDARFYTVRDRQIDTNAVANNLVNIYQSQGYQAQSVGSPDHVLVQFKKGGDIEAFIGLQASLSLSLQRTANGIVATAGQQKWIDKAAIGAAGLVIPVLWPLTIVAGFGVIRQAKPASDVFSLLDGLMRQQYPDVQVNPAADTNTDAGAGQF